MPRRARSLLGHVTTVALRTAQRPGVLPAIGIAVTAALCVPVTYFALFSGIAPYDDEGSLLILLRQYAQGGVLYAGAEHQAGPAMDRQSAAGCGRCAASAACVAGGRQPDHLGNSPLVRYIEDQFVTIATYGGYLMMQRAVETEDQAPSD